MLKLTKKLLPFALALLLPVVAQGAITVRYFSQSGGGDGTAYTTPATFASGGTISSVITGFDFSANAMEARVMGGSHTISTSVASGSFTNAPSNAHPLTIVSADASGNPIAIPSPGWTSARPCWDTSTMATITVSGNIALHSVAAIDLRLLKVVAAGRTSGSVVSTGSINWCLFQDSASNASAVGIAPTRCKNTVVQMSGSAFDTAFNTSGVGLFDNIRLEGNSGASSGNRRGFSWAGTAVQMNRICAINFQGGGVVSTSTNTGHWCILSQFVIVLCGDGYLGHSTASQTIASVLRGGMVTDNTGTGINANGAEYDTLSEIHLRDNTTANTALYGDYGTGFVDTSTADGANAAARQAAEYKDWASGVPASMDLRIKSTSTYNGKGYGIEDEAASSSSTVILFFGKRGGK